MTPTELALWLNGASDMMGDQPTPEQWATIKEKVCAAMGFLAKQRLLERVEDQIARDRASEEARARSALDASLRVDAMQELMRNRQAKLTDMIDQQQFKHMSGGAIGSIARSDNSLFRNVLGSYTNEDPKGYV